MNEQQAGMTAGLGSGMILLGSLALMKPLLWPLVLLLPAGIVLAIYGFWQGYKLKALWPSHNRDFATRWAEDWIEKNKAVLDRFD